MIEWQDQAFVLAARAFGDTDAIVQVLARGHGRVAGLVKGGQASRRQPMLQPGTYGQVEWRARLDDQLGSLDLEPEQQLASLYLDDRARLSAIEAFCAMAAQTLSEREPAPALFMAMETLAEHMEEPYWPLLYVRLELGLLATLGFSVDLSACALGGPNDDLTHVSPKTGRAVSREMATPYLPRLLPLPRFLGGAIDLAQGEVAAGLGLSGALLARHVYDAVNQDLPNARHRLAELFIPGGAG